VSHSYYRYRVILMPRSGFFLLVLGLSLSFLSADEGPSHKEIKAIKFDIGPHGKIKTMAMSATGNLLLGVAWIPEETEIPGGYQEDGRGRGRRYKEKQPPSEIRGYAEKRSPPQNRFEKYFQYALKIVSPDGKVLSTWPMTDGLVPKMICGTEDGKVYVGGGGILAIFDSKGTLLKRIDTDAILGKKSLTSGLSVNDEHLVIAFAIGWGLKSTEVVYRMNPNLTSPKKIVDKQYGCCAHIDMEIKGDRLLIAENSRFRVNQFDIRTGKFLGTWGRRDRVNIEGFAACCNPVNTDIGPDGVLYTAESGIGRVKKYSADGDYLGLVGYVDTTKYLKFGKGVASVSCYIPIEVNHDGSRIYIMDVRSIRAVRAVRLASHLNRKIIRFSPS